MGTDADAQTTIEVAGTIDVVAKNPPPDMTPDAYAAARLRRANDIVIVLEKNAQELRKALADDLYDRLSPTVRPVMALTFDARAPTFRVSLRWPDVCNADQRAELGTELVAVLKARMSAHITEVANPIGTWQAVVTAGPADAPAKTSRPGGATFRAIWWLSAVIAAAAVVFAAYLLVRG